MATAQSLPIVRRLPGVAQRKWNGQIRFLKARAIYVTRNMIRCETDSKIYPQLVLIGQSYIYWCRACQCTVWEEEKTRSGGGCPFCRKQLEYVKTGDGIRMHFRHAPDASWSHWYGERWDW